MTLLISPLDQWASGSLTMLAIVSHVLVFTRPFLDEQLHDKEARLG
jgi:hypothetical protein